MEMYQKLVISGKFLEFYDFPNCISGYLGRTLTKLKKDVIDGLSDSFEKRDDNIIRTRQNIRRLINSNADLNKFITLTFSDNITDVENANLHFKKFILRLKYKFSELKYLTVIEFQKRGAVHYHMVCNMPYINKFILSEIWGNGFIKINRINNCDNVGAYVSKYLSKEMGFKMFKKKKFFCSRDLERPLVVVDNLLIDKLKDLYKTRDMKPRCEKVFYNNFVGIVRYYQFKI